MKKNALEWSVFAASLMAIAACIGVLTYEQVTYTGGPPRITATIGSVTEQPGGFAVEVIVRNDGGATAENLQLEVTIEGAPERAEAVVAYVPYRSQRRAWLVLATDPRGRGVVVRVLGFEEP